MDKVVACLTSEHDWRLVGLAAILCFLAAITAIGLFRRAQVSEGRALFAWLGLDAVAAGFGIWATHFIAMLAYNPAINIGYDLTLTVLSFAIAAFITGMGLYVALLSERHLVAIAGGSVVGAGIAAMHYVGMNALEVQGYLAWSRDLVLVSVALGIGLGALAFYVAVRHRGWQGSLAAAAIFTFAILGMHFTGMAAVSINYDPFAINGADLSPASLAFVIAGAAGFFLSLCLIFAAFDWRNREKLQRQKRQLDAALENMSQGLCMFDPDGRVLLFNERYAEITAVAPDKLRGATLLDVLQEQGSGVRNETPEEFAARVISAAHDGKSMTTVIERRNGRILRAVTQPMTGGGWVVTLEDITEWQKAQAQIFHMARHDALTNLPNRTLFRERLEAALTKISRDEGVAVLCIDLDRFKAVNDTLGHLVGDELLREVAARLTACLRESDTVARLGGDEFAVVQSDKDLRASDVAALAGRLVEAVSKPYDIQNNQIVIGTSIGISFAPDDGTIAEQLLRNADLAMYRAKADGRGTYRFFEPGMDAKAQARRMLELELRGALARQEFELYYQPIHKLDDGEIIELEALIRWRHPLRGQVAPADFIPTAEETGLIGQIGEWVLRRACKDAAAWSRPLTVAVNMSPVQFKNPGLVKLVEDALATSGLAAERLELEITEAVLLDESEATLGLLHQLRSIGVRISMDDFGTGYSSLGYLRSFPFDKIKIDRSFVRDLTTRADAMAIVRAVTGLGRSLGIPTTAEGVETAEQADLLRLEGCTQVQGFHFGEPKPAIEVEQMLAGRKLRVVA
ncbi:EAL domain-containing protein [Microbacteriaceae bacterium K1510]|nr:EAL domain-containing protein [Microbacteriaceae bacterium K1510]